MTPTPTLVVNFWGGPDSGKSTLASGVFHQFKRLGVNCAYPGEFAKDAYEYDNHGAFGNQIIKTAEQFHRILMLNGKKRIVFNDSPIPIGILFPSAGCTPAWKQSLWDHYHLFHNLDFRVMRYGGEDYRFTQCGRSQDEATSRAKDIEVHQMLLDHNIPFYDIQTGPGDVEKVVEIVSEHLQLN